MRSAINAFLLGAVLLLAGCEARAPDRSDAPAQPATDAMRMTALRDAAKANGFVRAERLRIAVDPARREAGRLIFASPRMSLNGNIGCRDCHLDEFGSTDGLPNAVGAGATGHGAARMADSEGRILPRNVLPFWGRGSKGFTTFFWDGKVEVRDGRVVSQFGDQAPSTDPLVVAAHLPSVELREMVADTPAVRDALVTEKVGAAQTIQAELARRFAADPQIRPRLAAAYRLPVGKLAFGHVADALASFIRDEFRIRPTRLEHFVFDTGPISRQELAGGLLFYGRGRCAACHRGPYFSDFDFHAVAFPQAGFGKNGFGIDEGRYNVTFDPADRFRFRTPPLYNLSATGPYSHSGSILRIEDAIIAHFDPLRLVDPRKMSLRARTDLYARLGPASREPLPATLTDDEVRALTAFLEMLDFEKS